MNAPFSLNGLTLATERLLLRPFRKEDLDDLYEYCKVEGVGEMAGWPHHENKEGSSRVLKMFMEEDKTFAICLKETGKVIGSLGIEIYDMEEKLTEFNGYQGREIGFVLSKDYWGRGLMPEALEAVIHYLFEVLNYDFLLCGYFSFNRQSRRVQEKCGFKPYRKIVHHTMMGTDLETVLNLLVNPAKKIRFEFSHPETLIYEIEDTNG